MDNKVSSKEERTNQCMITLYDSGIIAEDYRLCVMAHYVMTGQSLWSHDWKNSVPEWYLKGRG